MRKPRQELPIIGVENRFPVAGSAGRDGGGKDEKKMERPAHIMTLSGDSERSLRELAQRYGEFLQANPAAALADICFTANGGSAPLPYRLTAMAASAPQLAEQLQAAARGEEAEGLLQGQAQGAGGEKIAFLFTGQGSQYSGMGKELYATQPVFRRTLEQCAAILDPHLERPLREVLFAADADGAINETAYTQPALFALEYSLLKLWESWGIFPDAVMGHSVGEYVAACAAGVFSLADGLKLVAARGRLIQELPKNGAMLAVLAPVAPVLAALEPYTQEVAIAAINGPRSVVISGSTQALEALGNDLRTRGIKTKALQVSHAFHSPLMEPMLARFARVLGWVDFAAPRLNVISNLTGTPVADEIASPDYWLRHTREPVRFQAGMEALAGYRVFIECGPQPVLLGLGRAIMPGHRGLWLPSLRPQKGEWQQLLRSLSELYLAGVKIDWSGFDRGYLRRMVALPG